MMNKNESKYFNTAIKMDEALIALLEKKDFSYITVKEICETAGVNRSTFYLHYENTSDLLKETTRYILDRFLSYFPLDIKNIADRYTTNDLTALVFIKPEYLKPYLTFIKENRPVFQTAVRHLGTMGFEEVYEKMYQHIFVPILSRFDYSNQTHPYVIKFYLSGITAIVMEWIENNCNDDIDTIIKIITVCIMGKQNAND